MTRILGIDPGLQRTGFGVIDQHGPALHYVTSGVIRTNPEGSLAERIRTIVDGIAEVARETKPDCAVVEIVFVNVNPKSTLLLGQARGAALLAPASLGIPVAEYAPNQIKKSVVGAGHADKDQVKHMVRMLLPRAQMKTADSTDALAIAICHAHHRTPRALALTLARS